MHTQFLMSEQCVTVITLWECVGGDRTMYTLHWVWMNDENVTLDKRIVSGQENLLGVPLFLGEITCWGRFISSSVLSQSGWWVMINSIVKELWIPEKLNGQHFMLHCLCYPSNRFTCNLLFRQYLADLLLY